MIINYYDNEEDIVEDDGNVVEEDVQIGVKYEEDVAGGYDEDVNDRLFQNDYES